MGGSLEHRAESGRRIWVPLVVFVGVAAASGFVWDSLDTEAGARFERAVLSEKASIQNALQGRMEARIEPLVRLARRWENVSDAERQDWEFDAALMYESPSYAAVSWVDENLRLRWAVPREVLQEFAGKASDFDDPRRAAFASARDSRDLVVSAPAALFGGGEGFLVVVPMIRAGQVNGYIVGSFRNSTLFPHILSGVAPGYAWALYDGNVLIYRHALASEPEDPDWTRSAQLSFYGRDWRLRVWPAQQTIAAAGTPLPTVVLVGGILLAAMLGLVLHQAETAVRNARHLEQANLELRSVTGRLLQAQDDERRRIARDLHDSTAQKLTALILSLGSIDDSDSPTDSRALKALRTALDLAKQSAQEIRTASYLLHPPMLDEVGLPTALRWYVEGFAARSEIEVGLHFPAEFPRLPRDLETALFRLVQECLANVHRHSGGSRAEISLAYRPGTVTLEVHDNGRGIPSEVLERINQGATSVGVGVAGMRGRLRQFGGTLSLAADSDGATVTAVVPFSAT